MREISILKNIEHPFIVKYIASGDNPPHLVIEYCKNGNLNHKMAEGELTKEEIYKISFQILQAITYCHDIGCLHRDLKPSNILIGDDGNIKICDFGLAKDSNIESDKSNLHATQLYMSPEFKTAPGFKVDVWGIGCIIYELFVGSHPYGGIRNEQMFE